MHDTIEFSYNHKYFSGIQDVSGFDPIFRFSDEYLNIMKSLPGDHMNLDTPLAIVLKFIDDNKKVEETHSFYVTRKNIEHYELRNSKIHEDILAWLIVDILKRFDKTFSIESVNTIAYNMKDSSRLKKELNYVLLKFICFFRKKKKSQTSIIKKIQSRELDELLGRFQTEGETCWNKKKKSKT